MFAFIFSNAQYFFGPENLISNNSLAQPEYFEAADLDSDGDLDALITSNGSRAVGWHENLDGKGNFGPLNLIAGGLDQPSNALATDVDGDGDLDIVCAVWGNYDLFWLENLEGAGTFGEIKMIDDYANGIWRVRSADLDGDGDQDLVTAEREGSKIAWYENLDGKGDFSEKIIIKGDMSNARDAFPVDLDNDGDLDLVTADWFTEVIGWHENTDGNGTFSERIEIYNGADDINIIFCKDIDGDGFMDILSRNRTDVFWIRNTDGGDNFSQPNDISQGQNIVDYFPTDFDGDGDFDILGIHTYNGNLGWYANDGKGVFGPLQIIPNDIGGAHIIHAADLDGDNDQDYIAMSWTKSWIYYHENEDGKGTTQIGKFISRPDIANPVDMVLSDINGDGDKEILLASETENKIYFYERMARDGEYGPISEVSGFIFQPLSIHPVDIDGDGLKDILSASYSDGGFYWSRNTGNNQFALPILIGKVPSTASDVFGVDLDGDGDVDVLGTSMYANQLVVYKNDGTGSFGQGIIISDQLKGAFDVIATDLDGDSDADIAVAVRIDDKISWFENLGGLNFSDENIIDADMNGTRKVVSGDIDGDGDPDLVASAFRKLMWYENLGGGAGFTAGKELHSEVAILDNINDIKLYDIDGDGDLDVFVVSEDRGYISWFTNNGDATFNSEIAIAGNLNEPTTIGFDDVDGDGRPDAILASKNDNKIGWYRNEEYPVFIQQPQDQIICQSGSATYQIATDKADNYQWQISWPYSTLFEDLEEDIGFSGTKSPNLTVDVPDTGLDKARFRCVITFLGAGFTSDPALLTVDRLYEADAGVDEETCNSWVQLYGSDPHQATGEWTILQGNASFSDPASSYTVANNLMGGMNTFLWTVTNGTCISEDEVTIIKYDSIMVAIPFDMLELNLDEQAVFTVEVTGDVLEYRWYKDGSPLTDNERISGSAKAQMTINNIILDDSGNYSCFVNGVCNYEYSDIIYLTILPVNTKDIPGQSVMLYPNPVTDYLFVVSPELVRDVEIINYKGIMIYGQYDVMASKIKIDVKDLPSGIYFTKISFESTAEVLQFVK